MGVGFLNHLELYPGIWLPKVCFNFSHSIIRCSLILSNNLMTRLLALCVFSVITLTLTFLSISIETFFVVCLSISPTHRFQAFKLSAICLSLFFILFKYC